MNNKIFVSLGVRFLGLTKVVLFNLILFIIVEVMILIFTSAGYLVHLKNYQYILFIGGVLVQKTILLIALYLLALGVAFVSHESKEGCHFLQNRFFYITDFSHKTYFSHKIDFSGNLGSSVFLKS